MTSENSPDNDELSERGYFWWSDQPIPEGSLVPEKGAYGLLTISKNGVITLSLDGVLSGHPLDFFDQGRKITKNIHGILKNDNRRVWLSDIMSNGGTFATAGLSYENFLAKYCIVGLDDIINHCENKQFTAINVDISSLGIWINPRPININETKKEINIKYKIKNDIILYNNKSYSAKIKFSLERGANLAINNYNLSLQQKIYLFCEFEKISLEFIIKEFQKLEDFFLLVSGIEINFPWPSIFFKKESPPAKFYWHMIKIDNKKRTLRDILLPFPKIVIHIENIFGAWQEKTEKFGPGIYLYLATRRGVKSYVENDFLNMVIGLESMHRILEEKKINKKLQTKIDRILKNITCKKDKKFLSNILKLEPSLKERIVDFFSSLPSDIITHNKLYEFAERCSKIRNDISHFGRTREKISYKEFIDQVIKIGDAFKILYHLKILQEIGVFDEFLMFIFKESFHSFAIQMTLWEAGLLPEDPRKAVEQTLAQHKTALEVAHRGEIAPDGASVAHKSGTLSGGEP